MTENDEQIIPHPPTRYYTIVPVFCTAQIPNTTLDVFIERIEQYADHASSWVPRIISAVELEDPENIDGPSKALPELFISPFIGMDITEINNIFTERFRPSKIYSGRCFVVLDTRTLNEDIEHATCLIVDGGPSFDKDEKE